MNDFTCLRGWLFLLLGSMVTCDAVSAARIYVNGNYPLSGNGTSWLTPYQNLQHAIDQANAGDEIWVAADEYGPIVLKADVRVLGGFAGTETSASQSNPTTNATIIRGGSHAVISQGHARTTVLRGFRILDGAALQLGQTEGTGGGLLCLGSSPTIVACVFNNNRSLLFGGAVANMGSGDPLFVNCTFDDNDGGYGGGAMYNDQGSITVHNSLFTNNEATAGGAIANRFGSLQIANCTFVGNIATHARGHGGAVYGASTTAVITNSVFWNNFCAGLPDQILGSSSSPPLVTYSNVQGGWTGTGNINVDPAFENAAIGDYRLGSTSPCKNTGSNAALPLDLADLDWDSITINPSEPLPKDLEMRNRRVPVTGNVDMGAYERPPLGYGGGGGGGQ